jgi:hypothetical protein
MTHAQGLLPRIIDLDPQCESCVWLGSECEGSDEGSDDETPNRSLACFYESE